MEADTVSRVYTRNGSEVHESYPNYLGWPEEGLKGEVAQAVFARADYHAVYTSITRGDKVLSASFYVYEPGSSRSLFKIEMEPLWVPDYDREYLRLLSVIQQRTGKSGVTVIVS